jgi:hypothetical protein
VAALVVIAIALPPVGAFFKPYVTEAVFALLCIAFLRVDAKSLRRYFRRPGIVLAATAWSAAVIPVLFCASYVALGLRERSPDLFVALALQAMAPPLMAAPALAALMGLDATLVLCAMVSGTALLPITAPVLAYVFIGPELALSPATLGLRLFGILAGSALVGLTLRRLAGIPAIERQRNMIDGLNIIVMFIFVSAMMESVAARFLTTPTLTLGLAALAFLVAFTVLGLTFLVFSATQRGRALVLGFTAAQRNTGLMLAATAGTLPDLSWLYFAFTYFPLCFLPLILHPFARRLS